MQIRLVDIGKKLFLLSHSESKLDSFYQAAIIQLFSCCLLHLQQKWCLWTDTCPQILIKSVLWFEWLPFLQKCNCRQRVAPDFKWSKKSKTFGQSTAVCSNLWATLICVMLDKYFNVFNWLFSLYFHAM